MRTRRRNIAMLGGLAAALLIAGCGTSTASGSGGASASATHTTQPAPTVATVTWFRPHAWTSDAPDPYQQWVNRYNDTNTDGVQIRLVYGDGADSLGSLKAALARGDAPDIVGPLTGSDRDMLGDAFLDVDSLGAGAAYDSADYERQVVNLLRDRDGGLVGVPFAIDPGFLWYNKDIFAAAGLPDLPTRIDEPYLGATWDWSALDALATRLTFDTRHRKASSPHFDPRHVKQYGVDCWLCGAEQVASLYGGESLLAEDGATARIPISWSRGLSWWYGAMWVRHVMPRQPRSAVERPAFETGTVAMVPMWSWGLSSLIAVGGGSGVKKWGIAVLPSFDGPTTSEDSLSFLAVPKLSRNPGAAARAIKAMTRAQALIQAYGGEPARISDRANYFAILSSEVAAAFPGVVVDWSVIDTMTKGAARPGPGELLPNATKARADISALTQRLLTTEGLDIGLELKSLQKTLQADFNAPAETEAPPSG